MDAALETSPANFRRELEEWQAGLSTFDRGFIDAQKADFLEELCTPLVCAAAEVFAPGQLRAFTAFVLERGSDGARAIARDPQALVAFSADALTPWDWLPPPPDVPPMPRGALERRCPKLFGVDVLAAWPELTEVDMDLELLRRVLTAAPGAPADWTEIYHRCAHQETATEDAFRVMPFLLAQRGQWGWDADVVLSIAGVALAARPGQPWEEALRSLAIERLRQTDDPTIGLYAVPQVLGYTELAERLWPALDPDPEDQVLYCPVCDHGHRPTWKGPSVLHPFADLLRVWKGGAATHPFADLLRTCGQRAWASRVRWLAAARCPACDAPLLGG